jgi:hypothetical protein
MLTTVYGNRVYCRKSRRGTSNPPENPEGARKNKEHTKRRNDIEQHRNHKPRRHAASDCTNNRNKSDYEEFRLLGGYAV